MLHSLALWVGLPQLQEGRMGVVECTVLALEEECDVDVHICKVTPHLTIIKSIFVNNH
jgi:hypothetical protein